MSRDNFSTNVIEKIRGRVGNRCSNPACRVLTTGPSMDAPEKVNIIGIAAHICAASEGGPRYNGDMTPRERKGMDNGLWLCANCSIDIDKDETRYPPDVLRGWKLEAERLSREELGQRLPGKDDAINTLTSALSGLPTTFLPEAIGNTVKATTTVLQNLDPRFAVSASYHDSVTTFTMSAREDVNATLSVEAEHVEEFSTKLEKLFDHGEVLEIDSKFVTLTGSKLLERINSRQGKGSFRFLPFLRKAAAVKIVLVGENGDVHIVQEVKGELTAGRKTISFAGSAHDGIFQIDFRSDIKNFGSDRINLNFSVDFDKYEGHSLQGLPHFSEIKEFYGRVNAGHKLIINLEVDGSPLLKGTIDDAKDHADFGRLRRSLDFIDHCRNILIYFGEDAPFIRGYAIDASIEDLLNKVNAAITQKNIFPATAFGSGLTTVITFHAEESGVLRDNGPRELALEQVTPQNVDLFGYRINLPRIALKFDKAVPIFDVVLDDVKENDELVIKWQFEPDCICTIVLL